MCLGPENSRKAPNGRTSRRRVLGMATTWGVGAVAGLSGAAETRSPRRASAPELQPLPMTNTGPGQIPHKPLGRTGVMVSILGMGGTGDAVKRGLVTGEELLRYAMSLPAATTISGMDSPQVLRQNLAIARDFRPLSAGEMQALRDRCAPIAADGHLELYKSTKKYDADEGRKQHGYPLQSELRL